LRVYSPRKEKSTSPTAMATAAPVKSVVEIGCTSKSAPAACSCRALITSGLKSGTVVVVDWGPLAALSILIFLMDVP